MVANIVILQSGHYAELPDLLATCKKYDVIAGCELSDNEADNQELIHLLLKGQHRYCIALPSLQQLGKEQYNFFISYLYTLQLGIKYYYRASQPVFPYAHEDQDQENTLKAVTADLVKCGLSRPLFIPFELRNGIHQHANNITISLDGQGLEKITAVGEFYKDLLQVPYLIDKHIFIKSSDQKSIEELLLTIKEIEEQKEKERDPIFIMHQLHRSMNDSLNAALENIRLLQEDVDSKQKYLAFLKGSASNEDGSVILNEVEKIKGFYHYEYEILPLWYKQFGHIIKVLKGKRKFRSLFDDKVKGKYPDK